MHTTIAGGLWKGKKKKHIPVSYPSGSTLPRRFWFKPGESTRMGMFENTHQWLWQGDRIRTINLISPRSRRDAGKICLWIHRQLQESWEFRGFASPCFVVSEAWGAAGNFTRLNLKAVIFTDHTNFIRHLYTNINTQTHTHSYLYACLLCLKKDKVRAEECTYGRQYPKDFP